MCFHSFKSIFCLYTANAWIGLFRSEIVKMIKYLSLNKSDNYYMKAVCLSGLANDESLNLVSIFHCFQYGYLERKQIDIFNLTVDVINVICTSIFIIFLTRLKSV